MKSTSGIDAADHYAAHSVKFTKRLALFVLVVVVASFVIVMARVNRPIKITLVLCNTSGEVVSDFVASFHGGELNIDSVQHNSITKVKFVPRGDSGGLDLAFTSADDKRIQYSCDIYFTGRDEGEVIVLLGPNGTVMVKDDTRMASLL